MVSVISATRTPRQERILGMCSTREGTPELSQPPHGKLHSRGRPTASGKPSRHTPTMCTRHVSPGSCGTTHRPCGAATPRTGHQPLGQVEPSCLASTADGSSDLAIIMPDKPPTCCLCSEKANSIFAHGNLGVGSYRPWANYNKVYQNGRAVAKRPTGTCCMPINH